MVKKAITALILVLFLWAQPISAVGMTGGNYEVVADVFSVSEGGDMIGGNYSLGGVSGEIGAEIITDGSFELHGGFFGAVGGTGLSYSLSASSISLDFGSTPLTTVASGSLILTVTTDSGSGYAATISEDGNLRSGANDINDVTDGSVTAGSEEYGISTTGSDGQLSLDTAISGTVTVASNSGVVSARVTTVYFKAGVSTGSLAGSYSHTTTFTITANP